MRLLASTGPAWAIRRLCIPAVILGVWVAWWPAQATAGGDGLFRGRLLSAGNLALQPALREEEKRDFIVHMGGAVGIAAGSYQLVKGASLGGHSEWVFPLAGSVLVLLAAWQVDEYLENTAQLETVDREIQDYEGSESDNGFSDLTSEFEILRERAVTNIILATLFGSLAFASFQAGGSEQDKAGGNAGSKPGGGASGAGRLAMVVPFYLPDAGLVGVEAAWTF